MLILPAAARRFVVVTAALALTACQRDPVAPRPDDVRAPARRALVASTDPLDAALAAIGDEAGMLLAEVDLAWRRGVSLRVGQPPVSTGLVVDCAVLGLRASSAASAASSRGGQVFDAIGRRDLAGAQGALGELASAVPPAVSLITTYVQCLDAQAGGGGGGGPTDRWR